MSTSTAERSTPRAVRIRVSDVAIVVALADGRTVTAPIGWYPRLMYATARERGNWRLIGAGEGVHWPDLDEDLSVEGLLGGRPSAESQASFKKWLATRQKRPGTRRVQSPARRVRGG